MVAIVSGNSLGLNLTSLATLGQQGLFGSPTQGSNGERVYVNAATGNLVLQSEDDHLLARGPDAVALRTYNSQGLLNDDNGDNWSSGVWLQPLVLTGTLNAAGSSLQRTDRDGSVGTYAFDTAAGLYRSTDGEGAYDTLAFIAAENQLEWRDGSTGASQRYEATGSLRLLSARDTSGNALSYTYNAAGRLNSVATASGDTTFYDYSGNNLAQIRTVSSSGAGNTDIRYAYDASNRLSVVTVDLTPGDNAVADGKVFTTTYTYVGATTKVARIAYSDGSSLTFTYVSTTNKVASVADGLGRVTTFTYGTRTLTVRDPMSLSTTYEVDTAGRLTRVTLPTVTVTQPFLNSYSAATNFTYNAAGDLLSVNDGQGRTTSYEYDAKGNQVLQRDALGDTITRTFDNRNQLLTETTYAVPDPDGAGTGQPAQPLTRRYVYDAGGRNLLRFAVSAEGRVTEYRYDGFGQQTAMLVYAATRYPVGGLAISTPLMEADLAAWAAAQPPGGIQRKDMVYGPRGALQSRTSYARLDATGAGILDGTQSRELFVYDQNGRLLQSVSPGGSTNTFSYDGLGRIVGNTDALGQATFTSYGDAVAKDVITLANGLVTSNTYDAAGRLASVAQANGAAVVLGETRYWYSTAGRLRMTQDPTGARTWTIPDADGRKAADIDANGTMTEYRYDGNGQLVYSVRYARHVDTASLVSGDGPNLSATVTTVRPGTSSDDVITWRAYDSANRLVLEAHTMGGSGASTVAVTETRYDGASRAAAVIRYANTASTPVASSNIFNILRPSASPQDRTARNFYDGDGLLVGTLDAEGYLTAFTYGGDARLVERLAYATVTDAALRAGGSLDQLRPSASAADIRSVLLYDAKGQLAGEVDGEGYLTETVRDASGNATQVIRYADRVTQAVTVASSIGAIRPAPSPVDRPILNAYDALNRLVQETSPEGVVKQYAYDSVGNLVSTTLAAGTTEVRTLLARYDLQGRLTGELSAEGAAVLTGGQAQEQVDAIWAQYGTTHAYDAAGRQISSTDAAGNRTLFFYSPVGLLTHVVNALGEVREKTYDTQERLSGEVAYASRISSDGLTGGLVNDALTSRIHPDSTLDSRTAISYTRADRVAAETDALGNVTSHGYNAFGEEINVSQPTSGSARLAETYTLDRRGLRVGTASDATGVNAQTTVAYDAFGRVIRTIDANGNMREQSFDRLGRVVCTRDPLGATGSSSYDAFGRVLSQTDALGQVTTYGYDATARTLTVTSPEGIRVVTSYNRHGQVLSLADGNQQVTSYSYDRNGKLLRTTTPLTTTTSSYDAAGRVIETVDASGTRVAYSYDAANRLLTRTVDPLGLKLVTAYQYDAKGQQVAVVDPNQVTTTTSYDRKGQVLKQVVDPAGLNLQTLYIYDARGRTLSVTTPGNTLTQYVYDALGRRTQEVVDPAGLALRRSWTYDKNGNVRSSTDATNNVTRYVYDGADRLLFTVDAAGDVQQTTYDVAGRVVKTITYATPLRGTLAALPTALDVQGLLAPEPALDEVEHRVYDADGRVSATVDGIGAVVRYSYDANGNVVSRTAYANTIDLAAWVPGTPPPPVPDPARDEQTRTVYDALNRAIYTVDGTGALVAQSFDGNGRVLQRTAYALAIAPGTAATRSILDAAVAALADPARDASVRSVYDAAGRLAWSVDGTGAVTQRVLDANGNVVRQLAYATPIAGGANPATVAIGSADRTTGMAYDAANRLVFQVDALNGVTEQAWDGDSNVVRRTAYASPLASVPTLGTPGSASAIRTAVSVNSGSDRSTGYGYDAAGRQTLVIDAAGSAVETCYDAAGRAVATTAHATPVLATLPATPTLTALKALVTDDPAADRITRYVYDAAGRVAFTVDALQAVTATQYDGVGRITGSTRYYNPIVGSVPNTAAALGTAIAARANPAVDRTQQASWDAAGRLVRTTDALGAFETYQYDALGRKLAFTNKNGATWTYGYDAAGRMLTETSPQLTLATVSVGAAGALQAATTTDATVITRMVYDALGNLAQRTEAAGRPEERTTSYEYDALGRQVLVRYPPVGVYNAAADAATVNGATAIAARVEDTLALQTRTFYDTLGNAVANRDVGDATSQKVYDRLGRLVYDIDALGYVTGYTRNAFGDVTGLVRYGGGTALAGSAITQASQAATRAQVDAALSAAGFSHAADRTLLTTYDRAGRVTEVKEPVAYVSELNADGVRIAGNVAKTTRKTYDAFGEVVEDRLLRNAAGDWSVTTHYFDRAGREVVTVDALGYLTSRSYDDAGNLGSVTEYANALTAPWTVTSHGLPAPSSDDDRTTAYSYDRLDRKTEERRTAEFSERADGSSTHGWVTTSYGYDAVGNQTRVTDANGGITYTYYDVLGRVAAIAAPARDAAIDEGTASLTPLTAFSRDAYGNTLVTREYGCGAATNTGLDWTPAAARADDRTSYASFDALGHTVQATDALGNSEFFSYDKQGHMAKKWQGVTGNDGITRTLFETNRYDALGQLVLTGRPASTSVYQGNGVIADVSQSQAGLVLTAMQYNAFGEMTSRGVNGGQGEFFDYDTAGRLWRTNSGDGVARIQLYDALGEVTARIRSRGAADGNLDMVTGFANAMEADLSQHTRRTDTRYDALGHVLATWEPAREQVQEGLVTVQRQFTTATITQSAAVGPSGWDMGAGRNGAILAWNDLSALGSGDIKVRLEYRTPVITRGGNDNDYGPPTPITYEGGTARSYETGVYASEQAASGVTLDWQETVASDDTGIGSITRIIVYKKDVLGAWGVVIDQAPGYGGNVLDLATPIQLGGTAKLELRTAGSAGDTGWWTASGAIDFGDRSRFDARGLPPGSYEYRLTLQSGEQGVPAVATGTLAITLPPLNAITVPITYGQAGAGVLAWQSPGVSIAQVLRYRLAGSTGGWSSLPVASRNGGGLDGVATSSLAAGSYQFELLWTPAGQSVPASHATGTFTITAGQAAYWVPPVNLPPINGLQISSFLVNGVRVPTIEWNGTEATLARYTSNGNWIELPIDSSDSGSGASLGESSNIFARQRVMIGNLPPNNYSFQVFAGSTKQATALFWIYPASAGHYQTVYVNMATYQPIIAYYAPVYQTQYATRTVASQVWVADSPAVVGYDEYGFPILQPRGHWETRYTTETYSYQVQVGTTPVYATDEYGNTAYQVIWVSQPQQQWVEGTTPTPTLTVTTPAYTPGYTVAAVAPQYGVNVSTTPGSVALSTTDGGVVTQSAVANRDDQWLRPLVLQKSDRWGNVLEVTDPRSAYWKTTYRYNANNQLVRQVQPDAAGALNASSPVTSLYYDRLGRQLAVRDAEGRLNGQAYDAGGNLVQEIHPDGTVTHAYDVFGQRVRTTSAEHRVASFTYDKLGRQLTAARGVEGVYQINDKVAWLVDTRNITDTWAYDQLGRKLSQTNGNGETTRYAYDLQGNVIATKQPLGQQIKAAYDAQGRKTAEVDATGKVARWSYNYFGQVLTHDDIGQAHYSFSYDKAGQLTAQTNSRGQSLAYTYDAAGQVVRIQDFATGKVTTYAYDLSGRHIRERVQQGGAVYQDNHLAYDMLGNLRDVADARVHMTMEYDRVGNRTRITTSVNYQGVSGEVSHPADRYFRYDAMNRQIIVDGVDAAGNIGQQGHQITYDRDGNRVTDTWYGNRVVTAPGQTGVIIGYNAADDSVIYGTLPATFVRDTGLTTEQYRYDALDRLTSVVRDGVQIDVRLYDGADRVIQSGPTSLPSGNYGDLINENVAPGDMNGKERRQNRYDANGRLMHQAVLTPDGHEKVDILWDPNATVVQGGVPYTPGGYDAAGNVVSYVVQNHEAGVVNKFTNNYGYYEGYQIRSTDASSSKMSPGSVTQSYDANGFLVGVTDTNQHASDRTFVNDASGLALFVNQGGKVQRQLIVNGEVLGIYGIGPDPLNTSSNPSFANLTDFDFSYAKVSASYPTPSPGAYQVRAGDTLQSIAQGAYGDSALWYRIAEANGLASSKDLKVGTTLNIPNRVSTISNNSSTFKPYDPSRIEGDKTPNLPMPKSDAGCGGVGKVLMVIVAVVATILTAGLLAGAVAPMCTAASATFGGIMSAGMTALGSNFAIAAVAGAVGSIASQAVGMATGNVSRFSWKNVALSAIGSAVSAGMGAASAASPSEAFVRAVGANAMTQGIAVATGLQSKFDWRQVAASAVGAAVGQEVGGALKDTTFGMGEFGNRVTRGTISGFVGGLAAAGAHGGRLAVGQVAADAFGNALGSSLAAAVSSPSQQYPGLPQGRVSELTERSQTALNMLGGAAEAHGGYDKIPATSLELKLAYDTAVVNSKLISSLAKDASFGPGFAGTVILADAGGSWKADIGIAWRQGARDLAIGGGVVTGMLQSFGDGVVGTGTLVKDLLLSQQYMLGGGDRWINRNLLPGFEMKQEAYQNVQALRATVGEIVSDPKRYLGDVIGGSYGKVNGALARAQNTDELNDWFFYGAAVGNVTLGVASAVAGAGGVARLTIGGARELNLMLRERIDGLGPDVRVNPFAPELSRGVAGLEMPRPLQVQINRFDGDAWEADVVDNYLPLTQKDIRAQITVRSNGPSGLKVRLDALGTEAANGQLKMTDAKGSVTARLTENQVVVYPELELFGGVVVGKGKAPYVGGMRIPPSVVDIIRKTQP